MNQSPMLKMEKQIIRIAFDNSVIEMWLLFLNLSGTGLMIGAWSLELTFFTPLIEVIL
jgi:hypothetical protein